MRRAFALVLAWSVCTGCAAQTSTASTARPPATEKARAAERGDVAEGDRKYDMLEVSKTKTGEKYRLYFDISESFIERMRNLVERAKSSAER